MPATWTLDVTPAGHQLSGGAASALLDIASGPPSAARLLAFVNQVVPVQYLSLVAFGGDAPELVEGCDSQPSERNVVAECFAIYRRSYFRSDAVTRLACRVGQAPGPQVVAMHCRADELPVPGWRHEIYEREKLTERLSLLHAPVAGSVHGLHLYRDQRQGLFRPAEVEQLLAVAPLLRQAHQAALRMALPAHDRSAQIERARQTLARRVPRLSAREREVCARIACGLSADGIAADLDIAPSTVLTLRKRAYLKLADAGLHGNRLSLARLCAGA